MRIQEEVAVLDVLEQVDKKVIQDYLNGNDISRKLRVEVTADLDADDMIDILEHHRIIDEEWAIDYFNIDVEGNEHEEFDIRTYSITGMILEIARRIHPRGFLTKDDIKRCIDDAIEEDVTFSKVV